MTCSDSGECVVEMGNDCEAQHACASGVCDDDVCCEARCDKCHTCNQSDHRGACTPIMGADDPGSCDGNESCSVDAECLSIDVQSAADEIGQYFGPRSPGWLSLAQTATLNRAGQLVEVRLNLFHYSGVDAPIAMDVYGVDGSGAPSGTLLGRSIDTAIVP